MSQNLSEKEFEKQIEKHFRKKHYIKIYFFDESSEDLTSGFIIKFSDTFLMLQECHNGLGIGDGGAFENRQPSICTNAR